MPVNVGSVDALKCAWLLLNLFREQSRNDHDTNKAKELAISEFRGACKVIDRLGMAQTDTAVYMAVMDSVDSAGERPGYRPVNNSAQQMFDQSVARDICKRLRWT